uniref:DH domain-containing protein n=1 Tax=Glossina pallidipes TaxID=7398 RepID=A0A1A9ZFF6_GLOPL
MFRSRKYVSTKEMKKKIVFHRKQQHFRYALKIRQGKRKMSASASTPVNIRICLIGEVANDTSCCEAAQTFNVPLVTSETGLELIADNDWRTYFVLKDFETPIYTAILKTTHSILGPPAIIRVAALGGGLKQNPRPVYNYAMNGIVACFSGIRSKELKQLVNYVHAMGGGIRERMNLRITHLISTRSGGGEYVYAKTFGLTVVRPAWVYAAWEQRNQLDFRADTEEFSNKYYLKYFEGQKICFVGFPADKHKLMLEILETNGGVYVELDDPECSHIVVGQHATQVKHEPKSSRAYILKSDWFWNTVQNGYAIEEDYRDSLLPDSFFGKLEESSACKETLMEKSSMRFNYFMELYNTESNYVDTLDTIINIFKTPLEESLRDNDALLDKFNIKAIFGNFLPIHGVHKRMFEQLRAIHTKWSEDCLIGDIILQHRDSLIKAYPPYVNFFDQMKETLTQCERQYPRFQAFLKINEAKPVCKRQRLQDLFIYPVQRLPRIQLLLNDILKHTNKSNPDYLGLEDALKAIKEVTMDINEYKRKTESQMATYHTFHDIEGCPPDLISSNRELISRCKVNELSNTLSGRGNNLTLYLFSDAIEVCRKVSRDFANAKNCPGRRRAYKHVELISLKAIRVVIDITDSSQAFAFRWRKKEEEQVLAFTIVDEEVDKAVYLKVLCKQMMEYACGDEPLKSCTSHDLGVDVSDENLNTSILSKTFKLAASTSSKVGRVLSFMKTPKLKRAVSNAKISLFGSTNSLASASQFPARRSVSCE